jgi:hypothetical protein
MRVGQVSGRAGIARIRDVRPWRFEYTSRCLPDRRAAFAPTVPRDHLALFHENCNAARVTGHELGVHRIFTGAAYLPEDEQRGLFAAIKIMRRIFGRRDRPPAVEAGIQEIEGGLKLLFGHFVTAWTTKGGMDRQFELIADAAQRLHPDELRKFEAST